MSMTLGEKLRQAREERDISISEVAEQTRISPLYLEAIENDDYSPLPGGIFNKGFIKSFAKYVGVDEDEALQDYARHLSQQTAGQPEPETKTYRPEVLTDDRSNSSMLVTVVFAAIILGLMSWGVYELVKLYEDRQDQPITNDNTANANVNQANANMSNVNAAQPIPQTDEIKAELKTSSVPVSVTYEQDGKNNSREVPPNDSLSMEAKQSLKFSFAKSLAPTLQLTLNGRQIKLPSQPANPRKVGLEIEINKENIGQILQSGEITFDNPSAASSPTP